MYLATSIVRCISLAVSWCIISSYQYSDTVSYIAMGRGTVYTMHTPLVLPVHAHALRTPTLVYGGVTSGDSM